MGSSIVRVESSSSSCPNFKWSYDVFLSFRGEDTRDNFTSHLDMALRQKGVNFFIDDKLERGGQISESLLNSIEGSRISIIIFSKNYASSSWCLDELVKIIECKKFKGQIVLPVFYKVDPSEVRKQTGGFGEALAKHEANKLMTNRIQQWKEALTIAAGFSGWDLATRKDEADLIQEIVKQVLSVVNVTQLLHVAKHPVGIDAQLRAIEELGSHVMSDGVNMVGMYGIGGIGKTTLAKALYNKISNQFEACCFLSKVREASEQFNGLLQLQEKLLLEILKDDAKVGSVDKGINIIKARLGLKKVLIVLDDVDKRDQLEALVGGHDWFGQGSRIIVTTKNKHLLLSHGFDAVHAIQGLHYDDALRLFSWHAFKQNHPPSDYLKLSNCATEYCKGLPLALVILGSFLYTREKIIWESKLEELNASLEPEVEAVLQISFKGLEEKVKENFLDISCFFVGEDVNDIKDMLKACDLNPDYGITILMDFSLITVENGKIQMHDLVQQMGQSIVCRESSKLGERSRLWVAKEAIKILEEKSGTDAIKVIKLDLRCQPWKITEAETFRNMTNLRLLILQDARALPEQLFQNLPDQLKWIDCSQFYFESPLPTSFILNGQLVGLVMKDSYYSGYSRRIEFENCKTLKHVDLSNWTSLKETPNFYGALNLEKLYLSGCQSLEMIHESVASLSKLVTLDLEGCKKLEKLPINFLLLKSLEVLNLSKCSELEEIPDMSASSNLKEIYLKNCDHATVRVIPDALDKLLTLNLNGCVNLQTLPSYFISESLELLDLSSCRQVKGVFEKFPGHLKFKFLKVLKLCYCPNLEEITDFSMASNLEILDLSSCYFLRRIHESIGSLHKLITLNLDCCYRLKELPCYLRLKSLNYLSLNECHNLEKLPDHFDENMKSLKVMNLEGTAIKELPSSIGYLIGLEILNLMYCKNLIGTGLPSEIHLLKNLKELHLRNCCKLDMFPSRSSLNFSQQSLCSNLSILDLQKCSILNSDFLETLSNVSTSLSKLNLSENKFNSLPSLHKFTSLQSLELRNCKFLRHIAQLPNSLQRLNTIGCELLVISPHYIADMIFKKQDLQFSDSTIELFVTNGEIPEYCNNQTNECSINFKFQHNSNNIVRGLVVCVIFEMDGDSSEARAFIDFIVSIDDEILNMSILGSCCSSNSSQLMLLLRIPTKFEYFNDGNDQHNIVVSFQTWNPLHNAKVIIRSYGVYVVDELMSFPAIQTVTHVMVDPTLNNESSGEGNSSDTNSKNDTPPKKKPRNTKKKTPL